MTNPAIELNEDEIINIDDAIIKGYKDLNDKCDKIIIKIKNRKNKFKKKAKPINEAT